MRVFVDAVLLGAARARLGLPERFVLNVGTVEPGKNRETLLRALALLRGRGLAHALVVVGQRGWLAERPDTAAARLGVAEAVRYTGYLPDSDLPLVYNLAEAFVFPSWREGFGLPPLEAMACGTPVVSSDRPAMPEVLGDAALYAPPDRPDAIADALARVLTDAGLRDDLRARGLARAAGYSWERAARETLAVYRRAFLNG
jgi:glycosyltransferase involved in cell wall biosynthesis